MRLMTDIYVHNKQSSINLYYIYWTVTEVGYVTEICIYMQKMQHVHTDFSTF